jgi:hypothetical protein
VSFAVSEPEEVRVQLARMEGKLDLSNMRHEQHDGKFIVIDGRLNSQGERITGLEKREVGRDGERKGITAAGRLIWAGIGLIPGGAIVAALMRLFGA